MGNFGDMGMERVRNLEEVRREIEKSVAGGQVLVADEWVEKYPELNPELRELLAQLIESESAAATSEGPTQMPYHVDEETRTAKERKPVEPLPLRLRGRYVGEYELMSVLWQRGLGDVY